MKDLTTFKNYFLAVTVSGNFIAVLESSTINVALYEISKSFNISLNEVQLVTSVYILVFTMFLPLFGKLSDMVDRNKLYAAGFFIFGAGAFFNAISQNFIMLLASRSIEALGGAILISNSAALITLMFKGDKRGSALGIVGASVALGGISGPAIAGGLIQFFGWHTIFIPSIIVGFIGTVYSFKFIPTFKSGKIQINNLDWTGFIYFAIALFSIFSVLACYRSVPFVKENVFFLCIISIIFWFLFYRRENKITNPLINFNLFRNKTFSLGCLGFILCFITLYANSLLFPFTAQQVLGYSPFITGLLILPFSIIMMIVAPFSGKYTAQKGNGKITVIGCMALFTGLAILLFIQENSSWLLLVAAQAVMGLGNGMFQSPSNTALMGEAPKENVGTASGLLSLARNSGMIIGIAFALGVFDIVNTELLQKGIQFEQSFLLSYKATIVACLIATLFAGISVYFAYRNQKLS